MSIQLKEFFRWLFSPLGFLAFLLGFIPSYFLADWFLTNFLDRFLTSFISILNILVS